MYILFRELHWKPSDYYDLPEGEKVVVRAFLAKMADESREEQKKLDDLKRKNKGRANK